MTITRDASRNFIGQALPRLGGIAAAMLIGLAMYHLDDPPSAFKLLGSALSVGLFAAGIEIAVRWEMRLITNGRVADAIVDGRARVDDGVLINYHFFTEDGRTIHESSTVTAVDWEQWPIGKRVPVIYDANRPRRHKIQERFWFVEWEVAESH